ncbi:hypothetical protein E2C01_053582 [Portunus trituberculatus]|uniref:Uncharacterized protein n=1 Tax=Portunus trituberculatus TaxID=210409 RepID=A0A5B7GR67_PORTR|nr:hypothetical protein [Portunus trituberculatus]
MNAWSLVVAALVVCESEKEAGREIGGMSMTDSCNIFTACPILHGQCSLVDQFTSSWSNKMCAKETVRVLVSQDLYQAVSIIVALGPRICSEGELANGVLHSLTSKMERMPALSREAGPHLKGGR